MATLIIQSTATIVQASGIDSSTLMLQRGTPSTSTPINAGSGIDQTIAISTPAGISKDGDLLSFEGASQLTPIAAGEQGPSIDTKFIVFFPDFSRSTLLQSVIGTSGTIEKFFDRSPFFFTPSELDPNTVRNLQEAQQFILFSQANIVTIDKFRHNIGSTALVSSKGDTFSVDSQTPQNVIINGGFEEGLSGWSIYEQAAGATVEVRDTVPPFGGIDPSPGNPLTPPKGSRYLYIRTVDRSTVRQNIKLGETLSSSLLRNFGFRPIFDSIATSRQNMCALRFLLADQEQFMVHYFILGQGFPASLPPEITGPDTSVSITGLVSDQVNVVTRNILSDISNESFDFDEIQLWWSSDSSNAATTDTLLDDFQLTVLLPPSHLLRTSGSENFLTIHPTASGFPFTISGSDDITQVDLSGPFFDETSPVSGTTFNDPEADVSFHVKDISSSLDQGTINITIDDEQVVTAGTVTSTASFPTGNKLVIAPNDIQYTFTRSPGFPQQSVVTVSGEFADFAAIANQAFQTYQFTVLGSGALTASISGAEDADPPTITPTDPIAGATQVSPNTEVQWTTADNAAGVDPSKTKLFLNQVLVLDGDTAVNGSVVRTANNDRGFDYRYIPASPFNFGDTITGTVMAFDLVSPVANSGSTTYEFTVTPDDTLEIINFSINSGETVPLTSGTEISVEVVDFTHGVESTATTLTVNGDVPAGLMTTLSGAGPDRVIFSFLAEPLVNFREDLEIFVHAENKFPGSFPVIKEETFVIQPGYGVDWFNKSPIADAETVFSYLTNIQVLTDATNFVKNFAEGSAFFRFTTELEHSANLGALLVSNIKTADLPAVLVVENPYFEYGKTMILTIQVADLEGNELNFTHTFTIEPNPN